MKRIHTLVIPLLALGMMLGGQEECEEEPSGPTPTPGELDAEVENADLLALIPITTVTLSPVGADTDSTSFATSFNIILEGGETLFLLDALDYLLTEFHVTSVLLTCVNGSLLSLESFNVCSGASVDIIQSRVITLTGSLSGGVLLDEDDADAPYIRFKMVEEGTGSKAIPGTAAGPRLGVTPRGEGAPLWEEGGDLERPERIAPAAPSEDQVYVRDMGMHW